MKTMCFLGITTMALWQPCTWALDVQLHIAGTSVLNKLCKGHNVSGRDYDTRSAQILQKQRECNIHCHCGPEKAIVVITERIH